MEQTTINQRVKFLIKALNISSRAFSASIDVPDATTRNYIDGRSKPSSDYLEKVVRRYEHINSMWLLTGEGEMFLSNEVASHSTTTTTHKNKGSIQNNSGNHNTVTNNVTLEQCQRDLVAAQKENELLKEQLAGKDALLAAKDDLIAAKEEMLSLLRGGHNRPN